MVKKFVLISSLAVLFTGCNTDELDFDNVVVQPITGTYAFPVGDVTYTMRELIENIGDSNLDLQEDSTSLLFLLYQDSFTYQTGNDFIEIPDINNQGQVDLDDPSVALPATGPGTVSISQSFDNLTYEPQNGEKLDSVFHDQGNATLTVNSTLQGTLDYSFTLNNTVNVNSLAPLQLNGSIVGTGTNTSTSALQNHKTILPDANNNFNVSFNASLTLGATDVFTGTESLTFELTFANQTFLIIFGKFGQDTVQLGNQTIDIDFFDDAGEGIFFGNPTITFDFSNSFGVPIGTDFSTVFADKGPGTAQTFLSGPITEDIPVINPAETPGTPAATTIQINNGNSTIVGLLATAPTRIGFDVTGISNPLDTTASNFVSATNEVSADIEIEIPMEIRLEDFEQTGYLNLDDSIDTEEIDSVFLRIVTVNELPFSALLNLQIQDADSNTLYTVPDRLVLNAPFINVDGFVTDPNGISADIPLGPEGIAALDSGSLVLLTATLNTPSSLNSRAIFVKVLADYRLQIKVGIGGTVNIEL